MKASARGHTEIEELLLMHFFVGSNAHDKMCEKMQKMLRLNSDATSSDSDADSEQSVSVGKKLLFATGIKGKDYVRELLEEATTADVNWQDEVR